MKRNVKLYIEDMLTAIAVKNIPEEVRSNYSDIPWKQIAGMRDVLIHEYFGVNVKRTLKVVKEDLVKLKVKLLKIKKDL